MPSFKLRHDMNKNKFSILFEIKTFFIINNNHKRQFSIFNIKSSSKTIKGGRKQKDCNKNNKEDFLSSL